MKRELLEKTKKNWCSQFKSAQEQCERKKLKRKASQDTKKKKRWKKSKQKHREEFRKEVEAQKAVGNYYMVKILHHYSCIHTATYIWLTIYIIIGIR